MRTAGGELRNFHFAELAVFRVRLFPPAEPVDLLHQQKHDESYDQKIYHSVEEGAVADHMPENAEFETAEIHPPREKTKDRINHVSDQRVHDLGEGRTNNNADCQIHGIALDGKFFKFSPDFHPVG